MFFGLPQVYDECLEKRLRIFFFFFFDICHSLTSLSSRRSEKKYDKATLSHKRFLPITHSTLYIYTMFHTIQGLRYTPGRGLMNKVVVRGG